MIKRIKSILAGWIGLILPDIEYYKSIKQNVKLGKHIKLYNPVRLYNVSIGDYSYVGIYSHLKNVKIGKFCSIGPKCLIGWGIHPIHGISTAPMFYSTGKQNGVSLSSQDKLTELKTITIGNDVFIGMNVTILDGITIGDGAVIGAGAVVSKDIEPYAVAIGNPIRILKYRFSPEIIEELKNLKWWDFDDEELKLVESEFFDIEGFIRKAKSKKI